jgi:hypothetical protein
MILNTQYASHNTIYFEFMFEKLRCTKKFVRIYQRTMPNKPNSPIVQMHLTSFITVNYAIFASPTKVKFKPNSNPIKANSKPKIVKKQVSIKETNPKQTQLGHNYQSSLINLCHRYNHLEGKPNSNPVSKQFAEPDCSDSKRWVLGTSNKI